MKHYKTAICAILKNEHQYLDEWIRHHLDIGFDEIYLYEDFGSKSCKSAPEDRSPPPPHPSAPAARHPPRYRYNLTTTHPAHSFAGSEST